MKKITKLLALMFCIVMCVSLIPATALAARVVASGSCGEDVTWKLTDDGTLTISGTGPMTSYQWSDAPWKTYQVYPYEERQQVKKVVIEKGVTSVGRYSFQYCRELTSVSIPDTVTVIGKYAFSVCTSLKNITIPGNVIVIEEGVFSRCTELTDIVIPSGVVTIGEATFFECKSLKSINIPASVSKLEPRVFDECDSLTEITVDKNSPYFCTDEKGVLYSADKTRLVIAFPSISGDYTVPDSVQTIDTVAFKNCTGLTGIILPEGLKKIDEYTFYGCTALKNISIPGSVTDIMDYAFAECPSLEYIEIPYGVRKIMSEAFFNCSSLKSLALPDSVRNLESAAFAGCTSLTDVKLSERLNEIDGSVFNGCTSLKSIVIPKSVSYIGGWAFKNCTALTSIIICGNVRTISPEAFVNVSATAYYPTGGDSTYNYWPGLTKAVYEDAAITWRSYDPDEGIPTGNVTDLSLVFESIDELLEFAGNGDFTDEYFTAFAAKHPEASSVSKEKLQSIAAKMRDCRFPDEELFGAEITDFVATYNDLGNKLDVVYKVNYVKNQFTYFFNKPVHEYSEYEKVADCTFDGVNFDMYTDPVCFTGSVQTDYATVRIVVYSQDLLKLGYLSDPLADAVAVGKLGDNISWILTENGTLTLSGQGEMKDYSYASMNYRYWEHVWETRNEEGESNRDAVLNRNRIKKVIIEDGITSIGAMVFWNCSNMTEIIITDSVTKIGYESFYGCSSLAAIDIPDGVTSIGRWAFVYCDSLKSAKIPAGVETMELGLFNYCDSLEEVIISDGVKTIESRVFEYCPSLKAVSIPASVTEIEWGVFHGCTDLEAINVDAGNPNYMSDSRGVLYNKDKTALLAAPGGMTGEYVIPEGVTTIGELTDGFALCSGLTSVTIPNTVTEIAPYSFEGCTSLTSIVLPNSVNRVNEFAFADCTNLKTVTLSENLGGIPDSAFRNCASLEAITIPKATAGVDPLSFAECTSLKAFAVDPENENFSVDERGVLFNSDKTSLVVAPGGLTGEYVIPDSVKEIYYNSFNHCPELTSVTIPASATLGYADDSPYYIDNFVGCTKLAGIWVDPNNPYYSNDENGVLYNKDKTVLLFVPGGYEGTLTIPASVEEIRPGAFAECSKITKIVSESENYITDENGVLFNAEMTELIKAPATLSGDYVIPDTVKGLDDSAFLNCASLESIEIPPTESLNTDVFIGCTGLSKIYFHGDMPTFSSHTAPFSGFIGTIFYPANNPTWLGLPDSIDTSNIVLAAYSFPGDVNLDGKLTNTDLITVARYVVRLIDVFTPGYINVVRFGDMNDDGNINNADIIIIARIIVGLR